MSSSLSRRELIRNSIAAATAAAAGFPGASFAGLVDSIDPTHGWSWDKGACRFCGVGCGIQIATEGGRVVAVKGVRAGERIGYGGRHQVAAPATIAVVPAGYADGLDRRLEGRGAALVRGQRAPIVGAVSMDMLTVDVSAIAGVSPGDEVVFLGSQGPEAWQTIDAREMAAWIGTIPYEVLCRLGARVARRYA